MRNAVLYAGTIVAVSHRWDDPSMPDPSGEQLRALKALLGEEVREPLLVQHLL